MNDKNWIKFRMIAWSIVAILLAVVLAIGIKGWGGSTFSDNIFTRGFTLSNMKVVKELKFDTGLIATVFYKENCVIVFTYEN